MTPAGTQEHGPITWGVYRDVQSPDPAYSFDSPEHKAMNLMCVHLQMLTPDSELVDGLATLSPPDDLTIVLDIEPEVAFWDGTPVTVEDVVYSLDRHRDPDVGSFCESTFAFIDDITASGEKQVTIRFTVPDFWFDSALAHRSGTVFPKAYAEEQGAAYGTPDGGTMCTGAYRLKSWVPSTGLVVEANPDY